jgi:hypothetical protein
MNKVGGKENYDPNTAFFCGAFPSRGGIGATALPARGSEGSKTSEAVISCIYRARMRKGCKGRIQIVSKGNEA